jgi:hypothetical protein
LCGRPVVWGGFRLVRNLPPMKSSKTRSPTLRARARQRSLFGRTSLLLSRVVARAWSPLRGLLRG